jgi:hypothetical protein
MVAIAPAESSSARPADNAASSNAASSAEGMASTSRQHERWAGSAGSEEHLDEIVIARDQHPALIASPRQDHQSPVLVRPISLTCTASWPAAFRCDATR